jgi:H/ACA ribonucleoprotein complex non-core subunit NAF1
MRDHDLAEASFVNDPYADFPGPSRPPPIPYDDPYSDSYNFIGEPQAVSLATGEQLEPNVEPTPERPDNFDLPRRGSPKDKRPPRGRDRGRLDHRDRDGGHRNAERGRGRGRGRGDRGHGYHPYTSPRRHSPSKPPHSEQHHYQPPVYQSPAPRQMSPTSMAIARATGGYNPAEAAFDSSGPSMPDRRVGSSWAVSPTYPPAAYNQPYVQPHINPRFASAYAGYYQSSSYDQYGARSSEDWHGPSQGNWTDEWTVHTSPQEERETRPERQ